MALLTDSGEPLVTDADRRSASCSAAGIWAWTRCWTRGREPLSLESETPVFQYLLAGRQGLRVLDVGCNSGFKTARRFGRPEVSRVMGLEYSARLVEQARAAYGGEKFCFYPCDLEQPGFAQELRAAMDREQIEAFDLIYISFVLMHLQDPARILRQLRPFLARGGRLLVEEAGDMACSLLPDQGGLFRVFLGMLAVDPYAGNRRCGESLAQWLKDCGYREIRQLPAAMRAAGGQREKKEQMFQVFFSYLPDDIARLRRQEPDNPVWAEGCSWLADHYEELHQEILDQGSELTVSVRVILCAGG